MHGHTAYHGYALNVPLDSLHLLHYGHCTQVLERSDPMAAVLDMPRCKAVRGPSPLTQHSMPQALTPTLTLTLTTDAGPNPVLGDLLHAHNPSP